MTIKVITDAVRAVILARMDQTLSLDDPDAQFLLDVLRCHPRYEEKLAGRKLAGLQMHQGKAGRYTYVKAAPAIDLLFEDGSYTDISWIKAARAAAGGFSEESEARARLSSALRTAVLDQILAFRQNQQQTDGSWISAASGERLLAGQVHVDHTNVSFWRLAEDWVEQHGGIQSIPLVETEGPWLIADEDLKRGWQQYHRDHAQLQILSAFENMSKGSR